MTRRERDLRRLARAHGWTLERTRNSHWRLVHPRSGAVVIASVSPGDAGNLRVIAGCLRRAVRDRPPLEDGAQDRVADQRGHIE